MLQRFQPERRLGLWVVVVGDDGLAKISAIVRQQQSVTGAVEIAATPLAPDLFKLTVRIDNLTQFQPLDAASRDEALPRSLLE